MMRTTWGDHDRFIDTYFTTYNNQYFTGDGCRTDSDGDYWLMGRVDDVVNVSGHRIGTAEVLLSYKSHEELFVADMINAFQHELSKHWGRVDILVREKLHEFAKELTGGGHVLLSSDRQANTNTTAEIEENIGA